MTSVLFNPYSNSGFCKFLFKVLMINKIIPIRNNTRELKSNALYDFYQISDKAPITKALLGTFITSHVALQIPMFSGLSKYLICLIPSKKSKAHTLSNNLIRKKFSICDYFCDHCDFSYFRFARKR